MKNDGVSRRRFLGICGGGIAGIWLAGTGLVRLPAKMIFAMSGSCSFCGKEVREVFGLAGITHRNVRVCDECIELCFDILAEEAGIEFPVPPRAESGADPLDEEGIKDPELLAKLLRLVTAGQRGDRLIDALARAIVGSDDALIVPPRARSRIYDLVCSFCGKSQHEVVKLIAGPTVYICDGCIGDSGALFMRYGWRPGRLEAT